ncbi:MAG TPA: FecR family protein [Bacteroidetes bacterium]|nr:FecR family protein [Bacteroidota bacterium]
MTADIINKNNLDDDSKELFSLLRVSWPDSREQTWESLSDRLKSPVIVRMRPAIRTWQIAMAASLALLLGIGTFMGTYTVKIKTVAAQHLGVSLPDGSTVELNAGTEIHYKPYWWWRERKIALQGEAYFEVTNGKAFSVESDVGITQVLGTSFNIYSRGQRYEVTCETGEVRVEVSDTKNSVILYPFEKASILMSGQLKVEENINMDNEKAWISNKLIFTSEPLVDVFEEIERQYDVEILVHGDLVLEYTGSIEKTESAADVLRLICRPFDLQVKKSNNNQFRISK